MISIRSKMLFSVLSIVVIVVIVFLGIYFFFLSNEFKLNAETKFLDETINYANLIEQNNLLIESHANSLSLIALNGFDYNLALVDKNYLTERINSTAKYFEGFLNESYVENPAIVSDYFVFSIDDFKGLYENWYIVQNGTISAYTNDDILTYYPENPDMQWYYSPKSTGVSEWTEVYTDAMTGVPMISFVVPLYLFVDGKKKFVGVLGLDSSLEEISSRLKDNNISGAGFSFLIDKNNNYIASPREPIDSNLMSNLTETKKNQKAGIIINSDKTLAFSVLGNNQTLVSVIATDYLLSATKRFESTILWVSLLIFIIVFFIGYTLLSGLANRIQKLYSASKDLEEGNYSVRVNLDVDDELSQLAKSFNKTAEVLGNTDSERKQVDKAKTEFLSITSHELRSPMTPMRAQLQMLMGNYFGKLNPEQRNSIDIVLRNTERLDKIVQDFLEISRIEAARLKFNFIQTSLSDYVNRTIEEMKGFMPEKKVKLVLELGKLPMMEVDPDRVMQVLRNLINNAIKFSKENGKVIIKAELRGKEIFFFVKDEGQGIKKEEQLRIFEPFFQAGGMYNRQVGGTGLGLAICKGIIESQNGKIWFESEFGKGTTFYFTVPLTPVKEMKPIKLLFSPNQGIEEKLKKIFLNYLGPLGANEFEDLKKKGITSKLIEDYIKELHKAGIIRDTEEFKKEIHMAYGVKEEPVKLEKKGIEVSDLKRAGLVK